MRRDIFLKWIVALVAALACITLHCTSAGPVAGTVTQGGNGMVAGTVLDAGVAVPGVRVLLVPAQYDPVSNTSFPDSLVDTTDPSGSFRIIAPKSTAYNVVAETMAGKNALRCNIGFLDGDTQNIEPLLLANPGRISVVIPYAAISDSSYVYIPGTTFFSIVHGDTTIIQNVPAGSIPLVSYRSSKTETNNHVIKTDVTVTSGMTTSIADYVMWAYSKRVYLNTTKSGADIAGNVFDFPVLVRLTASNFDFTQTLAEGKDVRFTKANGTPITFEVERWNAAAQVAEIWVKVDTVYGNDSTQSITMHWGNSNAYDNSDGRAVFDTSNGFLGVWHLSQKCDDVTYRQNNGTNYGTTDTTGIIGDCKKFDGSDSIKIAGLMGLPASMTISAWAQLDSVTGGRGSEIVSIGDVDLIRMDYRVMSHGTMGAIHPVGDTLYCNVTSGQFLAKTGWHMITFTVDQNNHRQTLFIDGSAIRSVDSVISIDYSKLGLNTLIGTHGNGKEGYNFSGRIDEVRISNVPLNEDWIKLCFMNQKAKDALVKW